MTAVRVLPDWLRQYRRTQLGGDAVAGVLVTVMLIPQSLAYALLAGLPAQVGLYSSIAPLVVYALFGSSMTLAVGPVAVASLMTASALAPLFASGSAAYVSGAMQLACLSGLMLLAFGALRLGSLAHFISHAVISGFVSGAAVVIVRSQLKPLLGFSVTAPVNMASALLGGVTLAVLLLRPLWLRGLLRVRVPAVAAGLAVRLIPMLAVVGSIVIVAVWELHRVAGVAVVGSVPAGLPSVQWPGWQDVSVLWVPALLIGAVGFVESVSVAQSLALKRGERIDPNREFVGLGAANVASAVCGGYPVTGGFARSVVNFSAGANTPLAGVISASLMALVLVGATSAFALLPHSVLAATLIAAVVGLIDVASLRRAWRYDRGDALSLIATFLAVVGWGVEQGIVVGLVVSFAVLVWRSSRPHIAVVGRVPGTEHFRNIERHQADTLPGVLAVRVDENWFFGNAAAIEWHLESLLRNAPGTREVLLVMSSVNRIDGTALDMLLGLEARWRQAGVGLSLAEVKGPVQDRLDRTPLAARLAGRIWLSTHDAFVALAALGKVV